MLFRSYGVEGFAPTRHLQKEDNSLARIDETLDFKIIEFSKENKKIILSHSRIYQDIQQAEQAKLEKEQKAAQRSTKQAVKKIKDNIEKTTLGDIGGLAELKSEMEQVAREKLETYARKQEEKEKKQKDGGLTLFDENDEIREEADVETETPANEEVVAENAPAETEAPATEEVVTENAPVEAEAHATEEVVAENAPVETEIAEETPAIADTEPKAETEENTTAEVKADGEEEVKA